MGKRINFQDKNLPGVRYILWIPMSFHPSMPLKLQEKLKEKFGYRKGRKKSVSDEFRKKHLDSMGVKDEKELLKKYPAIRNIINHKAKQEVLEEMGILPREFSKTARIWAKEMLEEDG